MLNPNLDASRFDIPSVGSSPGMVIQKLDISLAGILVISVLILIQLIGLLALAVYPSSRPTWTESLDSFAVLRLGAAMANELPLISSVEAKDLAVLDEKEGWIGEESGTTRKRLAIDGYGQWRSGELCCMVEDGQTLNLRNKVRKAATL